MFHLVTGVGEIVARVAILYTVLFLLFRLMGRKELGRMTPMDLLVTMVISEAVSASLTGGDTSVTGGVIAAATLLGLAYVVDRASFRSKRWERALQGRPLVLVKDGVLVRNAQRTARLSDEELSRALRGEGVAAVADVEVAVLEPTGRVTVVRKG